MDPRHRRGDQVPRVTARYHHLGGGRSGPAAFGEAGIPPEEIDIAMIYDSFTITVLTILEDLGFCKKGEGGA